MDIFAKTSSMFFFILEHNKHSFVQTGESVWNNYTQSYLESYAVW